MLTKLMAIIKHRLYDHFVVRPLVLLVFTAKGADMTATDIIKAHRRAVIINIATAVIGTAIDIIVMIVRVRAALKGVML